MHSTCKIKVFGKKTGLMKTYFLLSNYVGFSARNIDAQPRIHPIKEHASHTTTEHNPPKMIYIIFDFINII